MNLVGKIFVVLIFVMSIVFAALTVTVYATHKNWKLVCDNPQSQATAQYPTGLRQQLEAKVKQNKDLDAQRIEAVKERNRLKLDKEHAEAKLVSEQGRLLTQVETQAVELAKLRQAATSAAGAMAAAHATLEKMRGEISGLRQDIATTRADRDKKTKELLQVQNSLYQTGLEVLRLRQVMQDLERDLKKAEEVLRHFKLDINTALDAPKDLDTVVTEVPAPDLVAIKAGSDDGLRQGHELEVFHVAGGRSVYVGRIIVLETQPDRSVCRVNPNYRQRNVQVGDRATTKLKLQ